MQLQLTFGSNGPNKLQNPAKKKIAYTQGLGKFLDDQNIDIQNAYKEWSIKEIKGFLLYILRDLRKYEKTYRDTYKNEILACIQTLDLAYFTLEDIQNIESTIKYIQEWYKKTHHKFDNNLKNDYIKELFDQQPYILWVTGQKIDDIQKAPLMMSLYNSFIHSKKKKIKEKQRRCNRLFFINQLENKKIYYPYNRFANARAVNENIAELLLPPKDKEK